MAKKLKTMIISLDGARPMTLSESDGSQVIAEFTESQRAILRTTRNAVSRYLEASKDLLGGKLAHLKSLSPPHLADPGKVLVACCQRGVVIRYETKRDEPTEVLAGWTCADLPDVVANLSQRLIRLRTSAKEEEDDQDFGHRLQLFTTDDKGETKHEFSAVRIVFETTLLHPADDSTPRFKPFCLCSIRNQFAFQLHGELLPDQETGGRGQPFLAIAPLRLLVGWDCIEIYPTLQPDAWKEELAPAWAENDILAAVVASQHREHELESLDPKAEARRQVSKHLDEFTALLDEEPAREEVLQQFLTDHPDLLCPWRVRVWPKLPLGDKVTDFVIREATGDYLLVELEKSTDPLFVKSGHASRQLNHARGQISDWKRYLEDNLSSVQRESGLEGISSSPKELIVIGRLKDLSPDNKRKRTTMENEAPRLKILTYEEVAANARAVYENLLGPLWNDQGHTRIYYLPRDANQGI